MAKKLSHENLMKRAFGDDFWDRPVEERFDMAVRRCIATPPPKKKPEQHKVKSNGK